MAQRRMFSKQVTNSSEFLMMSQSAQNLYFHIGMNADDDGFCEVFTIMRMTDSKPDDLSLLHAKGFIFVVDSKVCIVKDWHENNQIRIDRYKQSKYLEDSHFREIYITIMDEKIKEIGIYSDIIKVGKPLVAKLVPQVRIGKVRIGKISKDIEADASPQLSAQDFFDNDKFQEEVIGFLIKEGTEPDEAKREIKKFVSYWTEPNETGKKLRWKSQKFFDLKRRLTTWFNNVHKFNGTKNNIGVVKV